MGKKMTSYLAMKTDPAGGSSEAAQALIDSDLRELGVAARKLANHAFVLGGGLGFGTSFLKWLAFFAAVYLLILDRTNWKTNMLTALLVPYIFFTLPGVLFSLIRGEVGKWIAIIAVILRLFFPRHFPDWLELPGALILLIVVAPSLFADTFRGEHNPRNGHMATETAPVIIVGAGPSGLAASACLSLRGVPSLVLERDDCVGSLWRKRAYDRLHLHLAKRSSALPHAPHDDAAPTYLPRDYFVRYLDCYAARFSVPARLRREVRDARFDPERGLWAVEAVNLDTGEEEKYSARYLVVATGEFDEKVVPEVPGLESFPGKVMHASEYRSAEGLEGKSVLVVGCGNSGMEIALDLAEAGAITSIVVRGELHLMTKEIMNMATTLFKYLPIWMIEKLVLLMCYLVFGDTSKYGLRRPAIGPFSRKLQNNVYPVIDVGTYNKIKSGQIQVLPAMKSINGNVVEFADGRQFPFDAVVFATGYRSAAKKWLKSDDGLIGDDGMAQRRCPKGENGLYCAGMARRGIYGSCVDAEFIADDISKLQRLSDSGSGHE